MRELSFMKLGSDKFKLLSQISASYRDVEDVLQLEQYRKDRIARFPYEERITEVFKQWDQNAAQLQGGYPHTWQGLWDILNDSDLTEKANEFFDFLEKH